MGALPIAVLDRHPVRLARPWYAATGGMALHRSLESDFVQRFLTDCSLGRLQDPALADWWRADRFSEHDRRLVLRLPIHRTFYLAVCEASCLGLGAPALDPQRIASAGFVLRRIGGGAERAWMLEDGDPLGWLPAPGEGRDPDLGRRLCRSGVVRPGADLAYTGEETHPLHPVLVKDAQGRSRTLLYGFVALGGQSLGRSLDLSAAGRSLAQGGRVSPFTAEAEQQARDLDRDLLPWPFSYRGPIGTVWGQGSRIQIDRGVPTKAFYGLLRLLVFRYHLGESTPGEAASAGPNRGLAALTSALQLVDAQGRVGFSLWDYLDACAAQGGSNPLVAWLIRQDKAASAAGGIDRLGALPALPARPRASAPMVPGATLGLTLALEAGDAQELRELLGERLVDQARRTGAEIPIPKFRQGPDDIYQLVPYVRARDDQGRERCTWAGREGRSEPFRVAAPFDPDASRPSVIQMPGLKDLKRGLAKGASMMIPPDTQALVDALKLDKGASADAIPEQAGPSLGIQWICSFSLPVITLVAMILLTIMISLLNILFFWLPWVRICLPFPKVEP